MSKTLKKYIFQLLFLGLFALIIGVYFLWFVFRSIDFFIVYSLPFKIIGTLLGYLMVNHFAPGGYVNVYFREHALTKEEKALEKLVAKHRSKILITLTATGYILVNIFYSTSSSKSLDINGYFFHLFFSFFI